MAYHPTNMQFKIPDYSTYKWYYFWDVDKSFGFASQFVDIYFFKFIRCNAVVDIEIYSRDGYIGMLDYAKNLDARFIENVCR